MALCSDAHLNNEGQAEGEPTEAALVNFANKEGLPKQDLEGKQPRVDEAPFDSSRKMMSTIHDLGGSFIQYTKGAPDEVLKRCTSYVENGEVKPMTSEKMEQILTANKQMADRALRVLAAAKRDWSARPADNTPENLEQDLTFIGLTGMIDPVRPEVKAAIEECCSAGIRPVMITGDHKDTAVAIAKELGIITDASQAITGAELDKIPDSEINEAGQALQRVRPCSARAQGAYRQRMESQRRHHRHDRRRRQRCPLHQVRRYRRGYGHHRHRCHQECGRHGAGRRQLCHHRHRRG